MYKLEDEPDVNHLDVRGGGQALHLADEGGGHHQYGGQVHIQGRRITGVLKRLVFK